MAFRTFNDDQSTLPPHRRIPRLGIVAAWALFGLWTAQQSVLSAISTGARVDWSRPFQTALLVAVFWIVLTPVLIWHTRRVRVAARRLRILAHVSLALLVHATEVAFYVGVSHLLDTETRPLLQLLATMASFNLLTYTVVVMVINTLDYHDAFRERAVHAAQLETQLAQAQLQVLRAQLHPHFLFNSLNAISALMHKDVGRADRMLARLSEVLRIAIDTAATPQIRLIDEVEFVKRYLETEQMRFGDRLDVSVDLPTETYDALVPTMLLQPLVENAVRHGVAPHAGQARVEIRIEKKGTQLGIVVRDTGARKKVDARDGTAPASARVRVIEGVGLRTTRERLEKLYGGAQELVLAHVPGGGFESRITLPFRRHEETDHGDSLPGR
jgi:sensor histidine kinase YesM